MEVPKIIFCDFSVSTWRASGSYCDGEYDLILAKNAIGTKAEAEV